MTDIISVYFKCLGLPLRVRIIHWLLDNEERNSTDGLPDRSSPPVPTIIANDLDVTLSVISHNLNRMHDLGVLNRKITGRYTYYSINKETLTLMKRFLSNESI